MAGHLLRGERPLMVWNRTASKAEELGRAGARIAQTLEKLGAACDLVFLCVNRSEDVRECVEQIAAGATPGTLIVDHSTISPQAAIDIHNGLRPRGVHFVDAPITGGSMGAQRGTLTVFCGGEQAHIDAALPSLKTYAKKVERVGGPGAGQLAKMANQIAVAGSLLGLCEALSFANRAGLDISQIREMVGGGAGGSWSFENYGPKILNNDWSPGFTIKNQRKDFAYCKEAAHMVHAAIPGTELVDALLANLQNEGRSEDATPALYELLLEMGERV
jgi:3-hydroxyisobutyrate dehydrogenase-like beta-hydroxyacid dehydrogenase